MRLWLTLLALLVLTACIPRGRPAEPPRQPTPPVAADNRDPRTVQCHVDLARAEIRFRRLEDRSYDTGCRAVGAVQLLDFGTPTSNLTAMTCPLARTFATWVREDVQAAAERHFGQRVRRIESMGTYACRSVNNQAGARLSEHAFANAVDIGAFVLEGGERVAVLSGWSGPDERARRFLRDVHRAGCRRFAVGLGPDANALHRDHLHFDLGRGPYCR